MKTAVVLINLGTPDTPNTKGVRNFLREFLADRRVVEVPRLLWLLILYGVILPFRSPRVARAYRQIWFGDVSPLRHFSESLSRGVEQKFAALYPDREISVRLAMCYGQPSIGHTISELCRGGVEQIVFVPMYPQYSATTTAAAHDAICRVFSTMRNIPAWSWVRSYHQHPAYIAALAQTVRDHWQQNGRGQKLLFSFHGIPKRNVELGDPYEQHCNETTAAVVAELGLEAHEWQQSFQSRLGKAEWLQPYTDKTVAALAKLSEKSLDVICPAFAVECLETLEEIDGEAREIFIENGGEQFSYIPCLNDSEAHQQLMVDLCRPLIESSHSF
ncbi:ferrochelatase [Spongiibacter sp. KMU-166]|uniref:Ferrochelatase n=1 Tax=Spongiibacter thalassae TaxID=2721624 RepID=A0ABX1GDT1_9GAMM|nr:ferrochelatase [Spongiibacter thalassae]NKI17100.1 ferrochelatase [Spongiibacter thalassae]